MAASDCLTADSDSQHCPEFLVWQRAILAANRKELDLKREETVHYLDVQMLSREMQTSNDTIERCRKTLTDYLTMFIPQSWKEPLDKIRLILQMNERIDWEALKGHLLMFFEEKKLSEDRVECLARVERLSESLRDLHEQISPVDWYQTTDAVIHAAHFRTSKEALMTRRLRILEHESSEEE